ncbi:MAG: HIT domain-containing protein [Patescibacteria group bacterium]
MTKNTSPQKDHDSIFAKIIRREIPASIQYEDDTFIVIDDIEPMAPVHVLIIPKEPHVTLEDVSVDDKDFHAQILLIARKVAAQLKISDNYKVFMNVGRRVQAVHHVHMHLLGGWEASKTTEQLDKDTKQAIDKSTK